MDPQVSFIYFFSIEFTCKYLGDISLFLDFLFYMGVQLIDNFVLVSDVQPSDSIIYIHGI